MTNVPLSVLVGVDKVPDTNDFIKYGLVEKSSSLSIHFTAKQLVQFSEYSAQQELPKMPQKLGNTTNFLSYTMITRQMYLVFNLHVLSEQ